MQAIVPIDGIDVCCVGHAWDLRFGTHDPSHTPSHSNLTVFALSPPTHTPRHTHEDNRCPDRGLPILRGTPEYGPVPEIWKLRQSSGPTGLLSTFHVLAPPRPMHNATHTHRHRKPYTDTIHTHKYNTLTHSCPRVLPLAHTHAHTRTRTRVYAHSQPTIKHTHTQTHVRSRACTHIYIHTLVHPSRAHMNRNVCIRTHAQTHAQAPTLANAHTHAHAHIPHTHARKDT